jgi:hypothetical protein
MNWSRADVLATIGIVVTAIAILVGALAARRWGTRRRRVLFEYGSTPLIPQVQLGAKAREYLKVTYRDFEVDEPHLVDIRLKNLGPSDVSTSHFDAGKPIELHLKCKLYGVTENSVPDSVLLPAIGSLDPILLQPRLFKKEESWSISAIVSGNPTPTLVSTLVDTDIVDGPTYAQELAKSFSRILLDAAVVSISSIARR